jgi:hypothetical protein
MTLRLEAPAKAGAEGLWLVVIAAAGVVAAAWMWSPLPTPPCLFHTLTGLPCPTCGGTRCLRALLAGDLVAALRWNPLVALGFAATAGYGLYAAAVVALRLPRIRLAVSQTEAWSLRAAVFAALAANWIYVAIRLSGRA